MTVADRVLFLVLKSVVIFIYCSPSWLLSTYAHLLSMLYRWCARKEMRKMWRNIELVFELPKHSQFARLFVRTATYHQFIVFLEAIREIYRPGAVEIDGLGDYREFVNRHGALGKGVVVISGHLGCWEFLAKFSKEGLGAPLRVLAKPAKHAAVTALLSEFRERMAVEVLWTGQKTILRDMLRTMKAGEGLGFVMDQKPVGRVGPRVRFLGHDAEFVSGPASIALKTGAPIIAAFCVRVAPFRYKLIYSAIDPTAPEFSDEDALTRRMVAKIEQAIRLYPEQWTWSYKRWKLEHELVAH